jgi:acetyltransferase-like isoleucine patch superfamily enzyme
MKDNLIRRFRKWGFVRRYLGDKTSQNLAERYPEYQIGRGTYGDLKVYSWAEGATLSIGAYSSFAMGVKIFLGGEHRIDWVTTYPFSALWASARQYSGHPKTKGDVLIGNDVWIGAEAMILSGVTIGDGAVIGARAVVSRDVPPYAVVAGNPAKVVKYRFEPPIIERLVALQWWSWSEMQIQKAMPDLLSHDIENFLVKAERDGYL